MASTTLFFSLPLLLLFVATIVTADVGDTQNSRALQLGQQKGVDDGGGSGYSNPPITYTPPSGGYPTTGSPPLVYTNPGYNPPYEPAPTIPMYPGSGSGTGLPNYAPPTGGGYGTPTGGGYGTPGYSPPIGGGYGTPDYSPPIGGGYGTPTGGMGHGSCRFWSWSWHHGSWPDILSTISTISAIFGKPAGSMFGGQMTLLQALENNKTDSYSSLLREGTAALLNSYAYKEFPFSPDVVKKKLGSGFMSSQAAAAQSTEFARANTGIN